MSKRLQPAAAYLRTSSAANVGADKNSDKRQRAAIMAAEYYGAAVSGADHIDHAPALYRCFNGWRLTLNSSARLLLGSMSALHFPLTLANRCEFRNGAALCKVRGVRIRKRQAPGLACAKTPSDSASRGACTPGQKKRGCPERSRAMPALTKRALQFL